MKHRIVVLFALFAGFTTTAAAPVQGQVQAPARASGSFTLQCDPPLVGYQFSSTQSVTAYLCETDATINGVAFKGLAFSQTGQGNATEAEDWGVFVGALANGDQVFFQYQATWRRIGSTGTTATMSYKIVGGTGIANGISGSGNCNATGTVGKSNEKTCSGAYAIP
jgi:hypothetical protein